MKEDGCLKDVASWYSKNRHTMTEKEFDSILSKHKKMEKIPKGERLEPWLKEMSEELSKRGIKI